MQPFLRARRKQARDKTSNNVYLTRFSQLVYIYRLVNAN